jgi:hypothetical protein
MVYNFGFLNHASLPGVYTVYGCSAVNDAEIVDLAFGLAAGSRLST